MNEPLYKQLGNEIFDLTLKYIDLKMDIDEIVETILTVSGFLIESACQDDSNLQNISYCMDRVKEGYDFVKEKENGQHNDIGNFDHNIHIANINLSKDQPNKEVD